MDAAVREDVQRALVRADETLRCDRGRPADALVLSPDAGHRTDVPSMISAAQVLALVIRDWCGLVG
jgi:hypothetical protein